MFLKFVVIVSGYQNWYLKCLIILLILDFYTEVYSRWNELLMILYSLLFKIYIEPENLAQPQTVGFFELEYVLK